MALVDHHLNESALAGHSRIKIMYPCNQPQQNFKTQVIAAALIKIQFLLQLNKSTKQIYNWKLRCVPARPHLVLFTLHYNLVLDLVVMTSDVIKYRQIKSLSVKSHNSVTFAIMNSRQQARRLRRYLQIDLLNPLANF